VILFRLIKLHANIAAFRGKNKGERHQIRNRILGEYFRALAEKRRIIPESEVFARVQDCSFPIDLFHTKKLMVFFVPEHPTMSGGIYSMFSIAKQMRRLKRHHGFDVILMTRPSPTGLTYFRNCNFLNSENVYRIEQLLLCRAVEELYIHVPEYASESFVENLTHSELNYLLTRGKFYVNLLNQNIKLMPDKESFAPLRRICDGISQSVAHHAYFSQNMANKYDLPTLLLPAFTDLSEYPGTSFAEKEKLIIYSPDDHTHKEACLKRLQLELPEFEFREIRDITFDQFMELATRCMFSITFGEGFDGYLAQPIHQGGIGFAVFNDEFFPAPHFTRYDNIFASAEEMVDQLPERIRKLQSDRTAYDNLNVEFCKEYERLYSFDDYITRIKKLSVREFEIFPERSSVSPSPDSRIAIALDK
jgi:hypothetical protein